MTDLLNSPWLLGNLEIKNRIVMPAMHLNMCDNWLAASVNLSRCR